MDIKEAAEILLKAKEIEKDPVLFKAAKAQLEEKSKTISSISDLRKIRESGSGLTKKDLLTEEDKAAYQSKIETDKKMEEMGFEVKDKIELEDDEEEEDND
jgi:hypothetical protein